MYEDVTFDNGITYFPESRTRHNFITYKVVKYKKILLIYIVYFIFSLVKI